MRARLIPLVFAFLQLSSAQRIGDFTRAPIEHEIDLVERPYQVRAVHGRIHAAFDSGAVLPRVLVELQGPGVSRRIKRAFTDNAGRFSMRGVAPGKYRFKATLNTWSSVMGEILVMSGAAKDAEIVIEMHPGS